MLDLLINYGLFLARTLTIVVAVIFVVASIASILVRGKSEKRENLQIKSLNEKYRRFARSLEFETLSKHNFKQIAKKEKNDRKAEKKSEKKADFIKKRVFVLDFNGDIKASAVDLLREEITALLTVVKPRDEVLLRLESAGGMVHSYGLAASQLLRLRNKSVSLTIAVDKVAASGGYMMACVADRIIAAPFAIIGSIGVVAQIPNINRLLKQHNIDYEQITAGKYKRTLTFMGENTDEERDKVRQELEETHDLFKDFVVQRRQELDIEKVATGEYWYGSRALELKLVDELMTSDDYLMMAADESDLFEVNYEVKRSLMQKLPFAVQGLFNRG
ncbi:MAG: protease SohB [Deltaproteobacteria bacterium]|jgi:serine protease SohB|nr:protease SohB [Deltaproteobacteria bacterium]MBT4268255.1 protease SohB [Deltaproteobacteria bacterium]MBT4639098.1 protease SohB [Deltaproteobacteria bacterium]MBT6501172.1 protease SohB [Deltaproteobacteria bacterium]MBT6616204.1 protease SohB [Deltaproteobacteria bacterium]